MLLCVAAIKSSEVRRMSIGLGARLIVWAWSVTVMLTASVTDLADHSPQTEWKRAVGRVLVVGCEGFF